MSIEQELMFPITQMNIPRCPKCICIPKILFIKKDNNDYIKYECMNGHKDEIPLEEYLIKSKTFSMDNAICHYCLKDKNIFYCNECNIFICSNCLIKHDIENKDHKLISINEIDIKCLQHNREINYCTDCNKSCCVLCNEPKLHNIIPISHMALENEEIEKLEEIINNMNKFVKNGENIIKNLFEIMKNTLDETLKKFKEHYLLEIRFAIEILETYRIKENSKHLNPNIINNLQNIMHLNNMFNQNDLNDNIKYIENFYDKQNIFSKESIIEIKL